MRRVALAVALVGIAAAVGAWTTPGCAVVRTALFLPQVLPVPVRPLQWITSKPVRQEVSYPLPSGESVADLYLPTDEGRHGAVLLFLGVNPAGRNDPRVVELAGGLARSGAVVLIPWSPAMVRRRVRPAEVENLVRGFQYLRSLEVVDPERVGMGGFCVGASLAMVAAEDPRIRDQVRFVHSFGGYYDAADLIKAVVTRSRFRDGYVEPWEPDPLAVEVVTNHLIAGVSDPAERQLLAQTLVQGVPLAEERRQALSPEAAAVYRLLNRPGRAEVDRLIGQLSPTTRRGLQLISPRTHIQDLKAVVLIMHDRQDRLVPVEESRRLAAALEGRRPVAYTEFSFFQHMDPTRPVGRLTYLLESARLFRHLYRVMKLLVCG